MNALLKRNRTLEATLEATLAAACMAAAIACLVTGTAPIYGQILTGPELNQPVQAPGIELDRSLGLSELGEAGSFEELEAGLQSSQPPVQPQVQVQPQAIPQPVQQQGSGSSTRNQTPAPVLAAPQSQYQTAPRYQPVPQYQAAPGNPNSNVTPAQPAIQSAPTSVLPALEIQPQQGDQHETIGSFHTVVRTVNDNGYITKARYVFEATTGALVGEWFDDSQVIPLAGGQALLLIDKGGKVLLLRNNMGDVKTLLPYNAQEYPQGQGVFVGKYNTIGSILILEVSDQNTGHVGIEYVDLSAGTSSNPNGTLYPRSLLEVAPQ
jgi:hypothetical protein